MSEKHLVCKGATVFCDKSMVNNNPGTAIPLTITSQTLVELNGGKTAATDKDCMVANMCFGTCKSGSNPPPPCVANVQWSKCYEGAEITAAGFKFLTEESEATCMTFGGKVKIAFHGQIATPQPEELDTVSPEIMAAILPVNFKEKEEMTMEESREEQQPKIVDAYWIDDEGNKIEYIAYDKSINLQIIADNVKNPVEVSIAVDFYSDANLRAIIVTKKLNIQLNSNKAKLNIPCENGLFSKNKIIFAKAVVNYNVNTIKSNSLEIIHRAGGLILRGKDSLEVKEQIKKLPKDITNGLIYQTEIFVFQMVKYTLSINERKYLKTFKHYNDTHIDLYELILAKKDKIKIGGNYSALLNICILEYSELYISSKQITRNIETNKVGIDAPFPFLNDKYSYSEEKWLEINGEKKFYGKVFYNGKKYTFDAFEKQLIIENGGMGITLYPQNYQMGRKYHWCSTNKYNQVIVNIWMSECEIVKTVSHELYGHLLFKIQKKNHSHTSIRQIGKPGCNDELEMQIKKREKETLYNYSN